MPSKKYDLDDDFLQHGHEVEREDYAYILDDMGITIDEDPDDFYSEAIFDAETGKVLSAAIDNWSEIVQTIYNNSITESEFYDRMQKVLDKLMTNINE